MGRRRRAVAHPSGDALTDRRQPEQIVGHQPVDVLGRLETASGDIAFDRLLDGRNAQSRQVQPGQAVAHRRRQDPADQQIGKVRHRIAQRRQLPVQHGPHLGRVRRHHQIVETEVAVDNPRRSFRRQTLRQPVDQPVHFRDRIDLGSPILFGPPPDLTREIVARLAVVGEPDLRRIEFMQIGERIGLGVEDGAALGRLHPGQFQIPQNPALDLVHDIEHRADHAIVRAQSIGPRDRIALLVERRGHRELPVHGMGRGQQHARRLPPQHIGRARRRQLIGRVRLAALELADGQRPGIALDVGGHPGVQRRLVEPVAGIDLAGSGKGGLGICRDIGHCAATMAARTARRQPPSSASRCSAFMCGFHTAGASSFLGSRSSISPTPSAASRAAPSAVIS